MTVIAAIVRLICALNAIAGRVFSWFALAIVLVCFAVVVLRYAFGLSYVWMQDLYVWLNGAMFTSVAGFALLRDKHVRVDVFYRNWSKRRKALADLFGACLFLLPFAIVVTLYAQPYVGQSWGILEASSNMGGLPGLFILKAFLLAFAALLGLQGLAVLLRSVLVLAGRSELVPADFAYGEAEG
ncbi:TRAP transporter small permease subunit [Roseibium sp.]|uniref:TRAP transporter small permease subunit n=1 Tax=Roseibium sp. TaxID=1936156 RepID=UPI003A96E42A